MIQAASGKALIVLEEPIVELSATTTVPSTAPAVRLGSLRHAAPPTIYGTRSSGLAVSEAVEEPAEHATLPGQRRGGRRWAARWVATG